MAILVDEDFTRFSSDQDLAADAAWTFQGSSGNYQVIAASDRAQLQNNTQWRLIIYYDDGVSTGDYKVKLTCSYNSNANAVTIGPHGRTPVATSDRYGYWIFLNATANTIELYSRDAIGQVLLESISMTINNIGEYIVELSMNGSSITGYVEPVGGTRVNFATATDTKYSAEGFMGFRKDSSSGVTGNGVYFTDFSVEDFVTSISKSVSDSGVGADTLNYPSVAHALSDTGQGNDQPPDLTAQSNIVDSGSGSDSLIQSSVLALLDAGIGLDSLSSSVSILLPDTGTGTDTPNISVSVSMADAGAGQDSLTLLTQILRIISDAGQGSDLISNVTAQMAVNDTGAGVEQLIMSALFALSDTGTGSENINLITAIIKQIQDAGQGSDTASVNSVSISIQDSGSLADTLLIGALVGLSDTGIGVDVVNKFDTTGRITTITFNFKQSSMTFGIKKPSMTFTFN